MATPVVCSGGEATFGIPPSMGLVASVPFGIRPGSRKPGAATLIRCSRGSLALMTHLGAKKAPRDRDIVQNQMSYSELAIYVDEDLGLQDLVQTCLIYKDEVGHSSVWVCKAINNDPKRKKKKNHSLVKCKSKEIFG